MKHVVMTLFLFGGLALTSLQAQNGDKVCPPGCCLVTCCTLSNSAAAAVTAEGAGSQASCSPEALRQCCEGKKMSKKEMKACQAACEASKSSATADHQHVAQVSHMAIACQPACISSGNGKNSRSVNQKESNTPVAKLSRG